MTWKVFCVNKLKIFWFISCCQSFIGNLPRPETRHCKICTPYLSIRPTCCKSYSVNSWPKFIIENSTFLKRCLCKWKLHMTSAGFELGMWTLTTRPPTLSLGRGCGKVGSADTSGTRGPGFEYSHWQLVLNNYFMLTVCREDEYKEAGNGRFLKGRALYWALSKYRFIPSKIMAHTRASCERWK